MSTMELMIEVSLDGDEWCALYGENLQEGVAGFGKNPCDSLRALIDELERVRGAYL